MGLLSLILSLLPFSPLVLAIRQIIGFEKSPHQVKSRLLKNELLVLEEFEEGLRLLASTALNLGIACTFCGVLVDRNSLFADAQTVNIPNLVWVIVPSLAGAACSIVIMMLIWSRVRPLRNDLFTAISNTPEEIDSVAMKTQIDLIVQSILPSFKWAIDESVKSQKESSERLVESVSKIALSADQIGMEIKAAAEMSGRMAEAASVIHAATAVLVGAVARTETTVAALSSAVTSRERDIFVLFSSIDQNLISVLQKLVELPASLDAELRKAANRFGEKFANEANLHVVQLNHVNKNLADAWNEKVLTLITSNESLNETWKIKMTGHVAEVMEYTATVLQKGMLAQCPEILAEMKEIAVLLRNVQQQTQKAHSGAVQSLDIMNKIGEASEVNRKQIDESLKAINLMLERMQIPPSAFVEQLKNMFTLTFAKPLSELVKIVNDNSHLHAGLDQLRPKERHGANDCE
jgi:hypothetical protein